LLERPHSSLDVDPVFHVTEGQTADWWDEIQRTQAEFGYRQEISALYASPVWRSSRTVVDVGTGNGWWLSRVQERFPDKQYTGFDVSLPLVTRAADRHRSIAFRQSSHHAAPGTLGRSFDFLTSRLFLQHVSDLEETLTSFSRLVVPGGGALIIDSRDGERFFWPEVPVLRDFFRRYSEFQSHSGRDRAVTARLPQIVEDRPDWRLAGASRVTLTSTVGDNLAHFRLYYRLMVQIVEATAVLPFDFSALRKEWEVWCKNDRAYTHLALDLVVLTRTAWAIDHAVSDPQPDTDPGGPIRN
jgi:ubiquinone/menaquinone biosynthesis C-methylase UbiE